MCFQSIIQGTDGGVRSARKNGFLSKLGSTHGLCSRFHRPAVRHASAAAADAAPQERGWASLPAELLSSVLMRVEDSEGTWPSRKQVVACAGVCRSWRAITKEVVRTPEKCGKLTFPVSLKQPGPRDFLFHCFIKRNRRMKTYHLYLDFSQALNDTGKFLLVARKCKHPTCTEYVISLNAGDMSKGSSSYIGKLRSNASGTRFTIYDGVPPYAEEMVAKHHSTQLGFKQTSLRVPAGNYPIAHIVYGRSLMGSSGPKKMQCIMDSIPASAMEVEGVAPTQTELPLRGLDCFPSIPFFWTNSFCYKNSFKGCLSGKKEGKLVLESKAPMWNEQFHCWSLSFQGRVTIPSAKNFQLVASVENGQSCLENDGILLQFGKVGKNLFTMDYGYPLSAFQAFAICLSTFQQ